jgi:hypothetical protein
MNPYYKRDNMKHILFIILLIVSGKLTAATITVASIAELQMAKASKLLNKM